MNARCVVNAMLDEDDSQTKNSPIPWGSVCMDVAGSMGVTRKKYPLVFMDSMSGYVVTVKRKIFLWLLV